ncbi:transcription initiation factor TFIID subunit 9-like [Vigna unguiculata]|uniref:Transcription initiation factor TFIID subunit 9B n=1 Tax=Vigna unguiculata TaxID=3917 RepID=A0A4D6KZ48_VIGUN|nr:transcription initiation factor TFIID subunit 9-like [Vigna unguiculata]QCD80101.1 transcription initiation factor TFIID subunit 9B [Vigna unguiculata]
MGDKDEESGMPRDAKIVKSLLKSMGVEEYEPRVIHKFLELWYRYVVDVLTDAQVYSEHAGKSAIDCDDVKLAIQSKINFSFSQPPPREVLLELAQNRNKIPLPKTIAGPGIPLPPDQDTLISPNYQFGIRNKRPAEPLEETEDEETTIPNPTQEDKVEMQQNPHQRVSFPLPKRQKD